MSDPQTNPNTRERSYHLFRSPSALIEQGVVGYGWNQVFKDADAEAIIRDIGVHIGRHGNQIRRFKSIQEGDLLVVPYLGGITIGKAKGIERRDEVAPSDGKNQQEVEFPKGANGQVLVVPKHHLPEGFQRRLKIRTSLADLSSFRSIIEHIYDDLATGRIYDYKSKVAEQEVELVNRAKQTLLTNIRQGRTGLRAGGIGLELLVKELLEIDGYEDAKILPKNAFLASAADADIEASRYDRLCPDNKLLYLVQVKHHEGQTSDWGVRQLVEISNSKRASQFAEHFLVLVTSGEVIEETKKTSEEKGITILDGKDLIEWIWDSLSQLNSDTRLRLGISIAPQIIG